MPSLVYYGLDTVENVPSTIPLIDRGFTISGSWTFTNTNPNPGTIIEKLTAKNLTATNFIASTSFNINCSATFNNTVTFNNNVTIANSKTLTVSGDTLIKGDLYVNTNDWNKDTIDNSHLSTVTDVTISNNGGNIYAGKITGVAYCALYKDLGEKFAIDEPAPKGSIVSLGGNQEITLSTIGDEPFGIIATNPAVRMNENMGDDENYPFICWCGRVPCRIIGKVNKFDKIYISELNGVGTATISEDNRKCIGIALENKDYEEEGLIEVVTQGRLY